MKKEAFTLTQTSIAFLSVMLRSPKILVEKSAN